MAGFRKRVFANAFPRSVNRVFKKRRFVRRRRFGRKSSTYSTRSSAAVGFGFKAKRLSRRQWNHKLWDSTLQKSHYRSSGGAINVLASPAAAISVNSVIYQCFPLDTGRFWTTTGGAVPVDGTGGVAVLIDDIIIRGGKLGITVTNTDTTVDDMMNVTVQLFRNDRDLDFTGFNAQRNIAWDTTMFPDRTLKIGRQLLYKKFTLKTQENMTVEYRIPIQKIDVQEWTNGNSRYYWTLIYGNPASNNSVVGSATTFYNLSFSGDATA